jgi:signal transduction histidine kinase/ActR/RegA family two-component response regulator
MALPLLYFDQLTEVRQAAVTMLLIALATGAVASTAGYRRVFLAFAAPMLVPLALAWLAALHPGEDRATVVGVSLLILVYLGFLASVARQQSEAFEASCRVRFAEKALNERLQRALDSESEANRAKTQFLAAASHDLRQPIHSMNVLVAALQMRELEPKAMEIANLLGQVNQMLSTQLDSLLDVSRLDAGAVEVKRSPQRLDRLLAVHHETLAQGAAAERGLRTTLDAADAVTVDTDPGLLMRVIGNLTDNAMKYNRQGGEVHLRVWREGDMACVSVADTGIGIAASEQAKVFREFYQVDNVERDRTRGLGLGLSIVQRLSSLLGLQLTLASTPGVGTTVTLRLPALDDAAPGKPAPSGQALGGTAPARPAAANGARDDEKGDGQGDEQGETLRTGAHDDLAGLRVLVVDDEAQVRSSMRLLLEQVGCTVFTADGTPQARDIARTQALAAVLSDLRLRAGDDGLQVLRTLRPLQPGALFALITGDTSPERIRQAEQAGVPLLHKPVPLSRLRKLLAAAGSGRRSTSHAGRDASADAGTAAGAPASAADGDAPPVTRGDPPHP